MDVRLFLNTIEKGIQEFYVQNKAIKNTNDIIHDNLGSICVFRNNIYIKQNCWDIKLDCIRKINVRIPGLHRYYTDIKYLIKSEKGTLFQRMDRDVYYFDNKYYFKVKIIKSINKNMMHEIVYISMNSELFSMVYSQNNISNNMYSLINMIMCSPIIWMTMFNIFLIFKIYIRSIPIFYIAALYFCVMPVCVVATLSCVTGFCVIFYDDKINYLDFIHCVPVLNIPYLFMNISLFWNTYGISILSLILLLVMVYPLMVINVAYILCYGKDIFTLLQLLFSIFTIVITTIINLYKILYVYYLNHGLILSLWDTIKFLFELIVLFVPIICLETIHYFPILFSYYNEPSIDKLYFWNSLIIFNIPKALFIVHIWYQFRSTNKNENYCWKLLCGIIIFILSPLIPYILLMFSHNHHKKTKSRCESIFHNGLTNNLTLYYFIILFYLWFGYGLSFFLILYQTNFMVNPVNITIIISINLCIFITLTFPRSWYKLHKYHLKPFYGI